MTNLTATSTKFYLHGFVLKETDVSSILKIMNEQLDKLEGYKEINLRATFENGVEINLNKTEDLFNYENEGENSISALRFYGRATKGVNASEIVLSFQNTDIDTSCKIPIFHQIHSHSKDWVLATSRLFEIKVLKIKRWSFDSLLFNKSKKLVFFIFAPLIVWGIFFLLYFVSKRNTEAELKKELLNGILHFEKQHANDSINNPTQAIIEIEKLKAEFVVNQKEISLFKTFLLPPFNYLLIAITFLISISLIILKYYPIYNFCWGGNELVFKMKERIRAGIIGVVFGSILLGIIVNLLSSYIWDQL